MIDSNGKVLSYDDRAKLYNVSFDFEDLEAIHWAFGLTPEYLEKLLKKEFVPKLTKTVDKVLHKRKQQRDVADSAGKGEDDPRVLNYDLENLKLKNKNVTAANPEGYPDQSEYDDTEIDEPRHHEDDHQSARKRKYSEPKSLKKSDKKKPKSAQPENSDSDEDQVAPGKKLPQNDLGLITNFKFKKGHCSFSIRVNLNSEKLLMLQIVENVLRVICVNKIPGIKTCHKLKADGGSNERYIQTEGVNFHAVWEMDEIDTSRISSNDIHAIGEVYGIEAARNSIVREVSGVFNHYAIKVDFRH